MSDLIRRDHGPYKEALMSTLGTASGIALVVGIPTAIVAAVAIYTVFSVVKGFQKWKEGKTSSVAGISVRVRPKELPLASSDRFGVVGNIMGLDSSNTFDVSSRPRRGRPKAKTSRSR